MIKLNGVEITEAQLEAAYAEHVAKKEKAAKPWPQDGDDVVLLHASGNTCSIKYIFYWRLELQQGSIFRTTKEAEFEHDRRAAEREKRQAENRVLMRLKELDPESGKFVPATCNYFPVYYPIKEELSVDWYFHEQKSQSNLYAQQETVWEQIISEMPDDVKMMFS